MPKNDLNLSKNGSRALDLLTWLIAGFSIVQSAGGFFIPHLYRDGVWVITTWRGNDLVTLSIAGPVLIGAMLGVKRGSQRAHLVRIGMLFYMFYNYSFYVFGAAVNRFFLIYVSIVAMAAYALVLALVITIHPLQMHCKESAINFTCGFMMSMALIIAAIWIFQWTAFAISGKPPQLAGDESAYRLVASMDLAIQVPGLALGSILLWRRNSWGFLIAVAMTTADAVYMVVLLAFSPFAVRAGIEQPWQQAPLWAILGTGCLMSSLMLLRESGTNEAKLVCEANRPEGKLVHPDATDS